MKNKLLIILSLIIFGAALASCIDTDGLDGRLDRLDEKIAALESTVGELNGNIVTLNKLYTTDLTIVGKTELKYKDQVKGYELEFSDGSKSTVIFGADYSVSVPLVRVNADGNWEASFDEGENWQTYGKVNMDGATPQFKIDAEGYWTMSLGGEYTRIRDVYGREVSAVNGAAMAGKPLFTDVAYDASKSVMVFKITDGETLEIPVIDSFFVRVSTEGNSSFIIDETKNYDVELGDVKEVIITAPEGWSAVLADNVLSVTAPSDGEEKNYTFELYAVSTQGYIKKVILEFSFKALALDEMSTPAWNKFVTGADDNLLLDYSYAGYNHGESAPLENYGYTEYDITDYGAVANDGISDRTAFLAMVEAATGQKFVENEKKTTLTLNHVSKPVNAVFYFPEGEFILHSADDDVTVGEKQVSQTIQIRASNIIMKGAGRDKTRILMADPCQPTDPSILYSSPVMLDFKHNSAFKSFTVPATVTKDAAKGSFSVEVASTAGISAGNYVCLHVKSKDADYITAELEPYNDDPYRANWEIVKNGVEVIDYHQVASVSGNVVTFVEPIMHAVDANQGWEVKEFPNYTEVGIEDLTFVGKAKEDFGHHASWEDDGAYKPLGMTRLTNSWLRRVGFESTSEACSITWSSNISAYDIVFSGNRGHASVRSQASSRVLIAATVDHTSGNLVNNSSGIYPTVIEDAGNYHAVGVSKHAIGTVLWRNTWGKDANFESHATQPRATLIDCCKGGWMGSRQGGDDGQMPNHLADLTIWNFYAMNENLSGSNSVDNSNFIWWNKSSKWWKFLPPVIVGFHGPANTHFDATQCKLVESEGTAVYPESLYEAQLKHRLGYVPAWLEALK